MGGVESKGISPQQDPHDDELPLKNPECSGVSPRTDPHDDEIPLKNPECSGVSPHEDPHGDDGCPLQNPECSGVSPHKDPHRDDGCPLKNPECSGVSPRTDPHDDEIPLKNPECSGVNPHKDPHCDDGCPLKNPECSGVSPHKDPHDDGFPLKNHEASDAGHGAKGTEKQREVYQSAEYDTGSPSDTRNTRPRPLLLKSVTKSCSVLEQFQRRNGQQQTPHEFNSDGKENIFDSIFQIMFSWISSSGNESRKTHESITSSIFDQTVTAPRSSNIIKGDKKYVSIIFGKSIEEEEIQNRKIAKLLHERSEILSIPFGIADVDYVSPIFGCKFEVGFTNQYKKEEWITLSSY